MVGQSAMALAVFGSSGEGLLDPIKMSVQGYKLSPIKRS